MPISVLSDASGRAPPRIDVIMSVHNVEATVRAAIDSVRGQTVTDWRCIVVDDGSTDATLAVLRQLASEDDRLSAKPAALPVRASAKCPPAHIQSKSIID